MKPELRRLNNDVILTSFNIAVNEKKKSGEKTHWFSVTVFGKTAEFLAQYASKGDQVVVEGRLNHEEFTNKEGHKVSKVSITASNVQLFNSRDNSAPEDPKIVAQPVFQPAFQQPNQAMFPDMDDSLPF
jgi:single-strand DNA-binding protein